MNVWSSSIAVFMAISIAATAFVSTLLSVLLAYWWKDQNTRAHKNARRCLVFLSAATFLFAAFSAVRAGRMERQGELDRKAQASAGRLTPRGASSEAYEIGNTKVFFLLNSDSTCFSLFDILLANYAERTIAEQNSLSCRRVDGRLQVSARVHASNGLVAEIIDNEWSIPPPTTYDRNYSDSALEVKDGEGHIVFQVKLGGKDPNLPNYSIISFQGIFYDDDGNGIAFTAAPTGDSALITPIPRGSARSAPPINPLFKYPSPLHLGEPADPQSTRSTRWVPSLKCVLLPKGYYRISYEGAKKHQGRL